MGENTSSWASKQSSVKPASQSRGNLIMEVAEKIRPVLLKLFEGIRDENGMLIQPARVRAIALNMAQGIVKEQEANAAA